MMARSRSGFAGALLLLGLLAGAAAGAESFDGVAVVLEVDAAGKTLLVEPPIMTLHVTGETQITGLDGEPIELRALPHARKLEDGGYEVSGDLTISYEATRDGDKVTAQKIVRQKGVLQ